MRDRSTLREETPNQADAVPIWSDDENDALDLVLDPQLAALAAPYHRISSIPRIRFEAPPASPRIESLARVEAVVDVAPRVSEERVESVPPALNQTQASLSSRQRFVARAVAWSVAAAFSMTTGGIFGHMTRSHHPLTHVAMTHRVSPPATTARAAIDAHPSAATTPQAPAPIARVEASTVAADFEPSGHTHHHSSHAADLAVPIAPAAEAAAVEPAPVAEAPAAAPSVAPTEAASAPAPTTADSCSARCNGELACLAACVVRTHDVPAERAQSPVEESSVPAPLRETPARADVVSALDSVRASIRECVADNQGTAFLSITFAGTGHVTTAQTEAPYAGTPAGSCMARAVHGASVPPFARASFTVRAPFAIR